MQLQGQKVFLQPALQSHNEESLNYFITELYY